MEPFFQRTAEVESLVSEEVHKADKKRIEETLEKAKEIAKKMADGSAPIIKTLGDAVVGGSSQAVGSPTNCGRIAHELLNEGEKVTEITIELYPELFARRTINVPGVLMGAVYGCSTSDYKTYEVAVERVKADGVKVNIVRSSPIRATALWSIRSTAAAAVSCCATPRPLSRRRRKPRRSSASLLSSNSPR